MTQVGVPAERRAGERRIALVPETAGRLVKQGVAVVVEAGAGRAAGFPDAAYEKVGARIGDRAEVLGSRIVLKVQRPTDDEAEGLALEAILVSLLPVATSRDLLAKLAQRRVTALALELVPRITRAQAMDVLSSQATVAGYKAVLLGASALPRFMPMLTTAAGTIAPARAFVLGAGVAGLQAIATARRLGAVVSAFDVRVAAKEQVQSLGAKFVEVAEASAEGSGGYAAELAVDQQRRVMEALAAHLADVDLAVTTAQIPGRPAPRMITGEMVQGMKPGSVIVDLAAESGGNCALTRAGETVDAGGVSILGPVNVPASLPFHASQMFSRNLASLLQILLKDAQPVIDLSDEIVGAMAVTHAGELRAR